MDPKPKRKVTNYTGIAALITAIGGVATMLINQSHAEQHAARVQDSVLAVMQYRLGRLEERLDRVALAPEAAKAIKPPPRPTESSLDEPETVVEVETSSEPVDTPERALADLIKKVRGKKAVRGSDLRNLVQQMERPLTAHDLEL